MKAEPGTKPDVVKTHLRDMIIVPEMIGGVVGVYNGKLFNSVEVKVSRVNTQPCIIQAPRRTA